MNIAIVEDQKQDAELLTSFIKKYAAENGVTLKTERFPDGLDFLTNYKFRFDIVFMDIQMPFADGINISAKLREVDENIVLVFVTNMAQYAIKGYEVEASDFLVKPLTYTVFSHKFRRIYREAEKRRGAEIYVVTKSEMRRLNARDIDYVEVIDHKCVYHIGSETIESWDTLAKIYESLSPFDFCYCNACYLVNLHHVEGVEKDMAVVGGARLKISRPKKKEFLRRLSLSFRGGG